MDFLRCKEICCKIFCKESCLPPSTAEREQKFYLQERERLERFASHTDDHRNSPAAEQPNPSPVAVGSKPATLSGEEELIQVTREESFNLLKRHSHIFIDEMHRHFRSRPGVADRRNAMESVSHRKSLMKGILSVTTGMGKTPSAELKEGKKLPLTLATDNDEFALPACCNKPLDDPDDFFDGETYIVVNKQGTIFRFSKAKSLFLFDRNNKFRKWAVNLFITPMFAHFITLIILINCICMTLIDPPQWIEDYLEFVFSAIYISEATIKIAARGFVFHRFSYLRDPWNWLDFIVIINAIVTEIFKQVVSNDVFAKVAVLRAFRVLRAFKTMSVVPGLRAIVKALLRSIRALKDAVVLTIFCVSVFALIGYQLFHGTMRHKCIRDAGTLKLEPDSMFRFINTSSLHTSSFNLSQKDFSEIRRTQLTINETSSYFTNSSYFKNSPETFLPLYSTGLEKNKFNCYDRFEMNMSDGKSWSASDALLVKKILNTSHAALNKTVKQNNLISASNNSVLQRNNITWTCSVNHLIYMHLPLLSSLLGEANRMRVMQDSTQKQRDNDVLFDSYMWNCSSSDFKSNSSIDLSRISLNESMECRIAVLVNAADISCINFFNSNNSNFTTENYSSQRDLYTRKWSYFLQYGIDYDLPNWSTRDLIVQFQLMPSLEGESLQSYDINSTNSFIYFAEQTSNLMSLEEIITWNDNEEHYCKRELFTGVFFHFNSSNRPAPEPIYCTIGETDRCPIGYTCGVGGGNPDFGYTGFDHFFLAFLTSFRLVSLDAWSRLYYLTLHTIGPTYAIFYVLVVLLGSYYLVNLILAVVYMAYEEQQAVVEEEELEAQEREAEQREIERENNSCEDSDENDSETNGSDENDAESGSVRLGLITTSLGPRTLPFSRHGGSLRSRTRRRIRHRRRLYTTSGCKSVDPSCKYDDESDRKSNQSPLSNNIFRPASYFLSSPERKDIYLDSGNSDDDNESNNFPRKRARLSNHKKEKEENVSHNIIKLVITEPASENKEDLVDEFNKDGSVNHLALGDRYSRSLSATSSFSRHNTISDSSSSPSSYDNNNWDFKKNHQFVMPIRSLSAASSISEDIEKLTRKQIVHADVNLTVPETHPNGDRSLLHLSLHKTSPTFKSSSTPSTPSRVSFTPRFKASCDNVNTLDRLPDGCGKHRRQSECSTGPAMYHHTHNKLLLSAGSTLLTVPNIEVKGPSTENGKTGVAENLDFSSDAIIPLLTKENHISKTCKKKGRKRSRASQLLRAFINICGKWNCCPRGFEHVQRQLRRLVLNPFTDLLITLCIALNAVFMSLEQHPMEEWLQNMLEQANLFFTIVFTVEMITKVVGLSPHTYFRERWNVFDAVVVLFSLIELGANSTQAMSILRAFRLMRIVKLAKQWPILNKLLRIIGRTLSKLWHLTLVLLLVLYIFAVVGMQLLHKYYLEKFDKNIPRWNFIDFPHAFMVVFRIQCGEWVESMLICLNVASPGICIPLFILVYVIGNLVILNLFLALLLNSFSGDILQHTTAENNSISEAIFQVKAWARRQRKRITNLNLHRLCCQFLKIGVKKSPKNQNIASKQQMMKTPDTELTVLFNDEQTPTKSALSPKDEVIINHQSSAFLNGNGNDHTGETELMLTHQTVASNGNVYHNGNNSHRPLSLKHSNDWIVNGKHISRDSSVCSNSDLSGHSASFRRHRRFRHHRNGRQAVALARGRYRGMQTNWDSDGSRLSVAASRHNLNAKHELNLSNDAIDQPVKAEEGEQSEDNKKKSEMEPCLSCLPYSIFERGCFYKLRIIMHKIIHHRYFDAVVIFCILLSSVTLAMEDIHLEKNLPMKRVLEHIDVFCCIFFTIEMLMKWIGHGWKHYFTNPWCILDCVLVGISIANLTVTSSSQNLSALRALRTFRALRPLRALSRFKGMKIVVDALVRAIPSIAHVFFVCIVFWLIFSILGVNIFGGRFGRCVSLPTRDILPHRSMDDNNTFKVGSTSFTYNTTLERQCSPNNTNLLKYLKKEISVISQYDLPAIRDKNDCNRCADLLNTTDIDWQVPNVNFDNVLCGFLALIQVATFNGWMEIMESATDITGILKQPSYEASGYNYIYFCVFIVFGAFFSLNLFIGVIIDNFNQQKLRCKGGEDGVFLTDEQRRYYNAMKKMASKTPRKSIPRPDSKFANKVYDLVTDRKFEISVMVMIMINLIVMALEHHDMSPEMNEILGHFNLGFICIFLVEAILKLIGLRLYYFTIPWNVFDILVVVVSLVVNLCTATGLSDVMSQYFVQPTLFRIIRLFRVTRILRLIREAKGIRTLLFALMMSLPALFNIGSLLFLLMSIYAIIGMSQFPYIQKIAGVDDLLNFETFPNAFLILFQISTSEGWDRFLEPVLRDSPPYCDPHPADGSESNCGNFTVGSIYFVTYVMTTFLIVVNMYIAIILENFEVATRENAEPLTADDFEQYFEVWQRYDDRLSQFIRYEELQHLLDHLDYPLRVPWPNGAFISHSHMQITQDGRVHCLEVIIALIKKVLGDSPELKTLKEDMLKSFMDKCKTKEEISDASETLDSEEFTLQRRAAIVIQRAYRNYRLCRNILINEVDTTAKDSGQKDTDSDDSSKNVTRVQRQKRPWWSRDDTPD